VDIQQFRSVFRQLKDKSGPSLTPEEAEVLKRSVALYLGELLSGWYQEWCILERERYRAIAMAQLDKLIQYCLAHHLYDSGIAYSMNVLTIDPTREKTHRHLMRLYYLSGDRTGALRQFQFCKQLLSQELGVEPTKRTSYLHQQIIDDHSESVANFGQEQLSDTTKNKLTLGFRGPLFSTLTQLLGEMASVRNDIELIKQSLKK